MTGSWRMSRCRWFMYVHTVFLEWNLKLSTFLWTAAQLPIHHRHLRLLWLLHATTGWIARVKLCQGRKGSLRISNALRISSSWAWIIQRFYFMHQLNHRSIRPNSSKFRKVTDWDPFHGSSCPWYIPVLVTYEALRYFRDHLSKDAWISGSWLRKSVHNSWMPWHGWSNCFLPLRQAGGSFLAVWQVWLFHPVGDW